MDESRLRNLPRSPLGQDTSPGTTQSPIDMRPVVDYLSLLQQTRGRQTLITQTLMRIRKAAAEEIAATTGNVADEIADMEEEVETYDRLIDHLDMSPIPLSRQAQEVLQGVREATISALTAARQQTSPTAKATAHHKLRTIDLILRRHQAIPPNLMPAIEVLSRV